MNEQEYRHDVEIIEDTVSRAEIRFQRQIDRYRPKDKVARVISTVALLIGLTDLGLALYSLNKPAVAKIEFPQGFQQTLYQDTSRIAAIEDQINQIKKSPTLVHDNQIACLKAHILPEDCN